MKPLRTFGPLVHSSYSGWKKLRFDFRAFLPVGLLVLAALNPASVQAQPDYTFGTFAGSGGNSSSADGTGLAASFSNPASIAVDGSGNVYIADSGNNVIRKMTPAGVVTTFAGTPGVVGSADGTGNAASFNAPTGVAVDSAGNVYVADTGNFTVREITAAGVVTTLAGSVGVSGSADGAGSGAKFSHLAGVAVDGTGNVYVADQYNSTIRKITAGVVTTFAGTSQNFGYADGTGSSAQFGLPNSLAVDGAGNLYVVDAVFYSIRKITPAGVVTSLAGYPNSSGSWDGTGNNAGFTGPTSVTVDGGGNIYVGDGARSASGPCTVRKVTPAGVVTTVAGSYSVSGHIDGIGSAARFSGVYGVGADSSGNVYVAESGNQDIRLVSTSGVVTTIAGGAGAAGLVDGPGPAARFSAPYAVTTDAEGNIYVGDAGNGVLRKITPAGAVTTISAAGILGYSVGLALDADGSIYYADPNGAQIEKMDTNGVVSTVAGLYSFGSADGLVDIAQFYGVAGLAVDGSGNLYVADSNNNTIRLVANGEVATVAGQASVAGSADGSGTSASFSYPQGLALDGSGNLYVADSGNATIRKITPAGVVSTLAGLAGAIGSADGTGNLARFSYPAGLAVDGSGNIFVTDSGNHNIRMITPGGVVTTVAGLAGHGDYANGIGAAAHFASPTGIAVDASGFLYVADFSYNSIRVGAIDSVPAIVASPAGLSVTETQSATFSVTASGGVLNYQWRKDGADIPGAAQSVLTIAATTTTDAGSYDVVASNSLGTVTSAAAVLVVSPIPVISNVSPSRQVVAPGQAIGLSVTATGTGALSYQWIHSGLAVSGGTSANLSVPSAVLADGGWYEVLVTDSNGTRRSPPFFVLVAPAITQVVAWGEDTNGEADVPPGLSTAVAISSGGSQSVALKADGTVVGWGANPGGLFSIPPGLTDVVAVSTGGFSLALTSDGTVVPWGDDSYRQTEVPAGLSRVVAIEAGAFHGLALKDDGTVVAWGENAEGECIVPAGLTGVVGIAVGDEFSVALKTDGTVMAWGRDSSQQCDIPAGLTGVVQIATGADHVLALKNDGSVVAWGSSYSGQTTVPAGLSGVTSISAGNGYSLAVKSDGTVVGWGANPYGEISIPSGLAQVFAVAAGDYTGVALRDGTGDSLPVVTTQPADQTVVENQVAVFTVAATGPAPLSYQWRKNGANIVGATTSTLHVGPLLPADAGSYDVVVTAFLGSTTSNSATLSVTPLPIVSSVSSTRQVLNPGQALSLSVTATGTGSLSYQWVHNGRAIAGATSSSYSVSNITKQDGGWYTLDITDSVGTRISPTMFVSATPAVTQVRGWGGFFSPQGINPIGLTDAIALAPGYLSFAVLKADGTVVSFGSNASGQGSIPAGLSDVVALAGADDYVLALKSDGTLAGWGNLPGSLPNLSNVVAISCYQNLGLALESDGTVHEFFLPLDGSGNPPANFQVPDGLTGVVAVSAGYQAALAVKADGTVVGWGTGLPATVPDGLTGVVSVAMGQNFALALKNDGTVAAWGTGYYNQVAAAGTLTNVAAISARLEQAVAIYTNGDVVAWGSNYDGESSVPDIHDALTSVTGDEFSMVIRDGTSDSAPGFASQPVGATVIENQRVSFLAIPTGAEPIFYQWRKDGVDIPNAVEFTYSIPSALPADAGSYDVVVTNYLGSATSATATLVVTPFPAITALSPTRQVLTPGQGLNLSVTATGTGSLTYQWVHNGKPISGATTNGYSVGSSSAADGGWYVVLITDSVGVRRSKPIFVTVAPAVTQVVGWGIYFLDATASFNPIQDAIAVSAGPDRTMALRADGTVVRWGGSFTDPISVPAGLNNVVAIASGYLAGFALKSDSTVVAWGDDYSLPESTIPAGLTDVVAIAATRGYPGSFALALKSDGTVVTWGNSSLASGAAGLSHVTAIAAGDTHALALKDDGTIVAWGSNYYGETTVPAGLANVVAISAGSGYSLALKADGTVVFFGSAGNSGITTPPGLSGVVAISAGSDAKIALKTDATIVQWRANSGSGISDPPDGLSKVMAISAGFDVGLALRDGTGETTPIIDIPPATAEVVETHPVTFSVSASGVEPLVYQWQKDGVDISGATLPTFSIAHAQLSDAGSYAAVVTNYRGSTTSAAATLTIDPIPVVTSLSPSRQALTPGQGLNLSVTATGTGSLSYQWIHNGFSVAGATGTGYSVGSVTAHDGGWYVVTITDSIGTRYSSPMFVSVAPAVTQAVEWGNSNSGQQPIPASVNHLVALATSDGPSIGLKSDGTILALGGNYSTISTVPSGLNGVVAVATGYYHALALKSDGTVVAWGYDSNGQIDVPAGLGDVVSVSAGQDFSVALKNDGTVVAWGNNFNQQYAVPTGLTNVAAIAAGGAHTLALKNDGTVVAWGIDSSSQTDVPAGLTGVVAVAAGQNFSMALKNDGTVIAWGETYSGATSVPAGLNNVVAIAAGNTHALALKADGTVVAWGNNTSGQATPPDGLANVTWLAPGDQYSIVLRDATGDTVPVVATQPVGQTIVEGQPVTFSVLSVPGAPVSYQWQKNGVAISGATSSNYAIPSVLPADAGSYTVVLTNHVGPTTSAAAVLTVTPLPVISAQSGARNVFNSGGTVDLSVTATGTGTVNYQWKHNGVPISDPSATTNHLTLNSATVQASGYYIVYVTDSVGTRQSATMFVNVAPTITEVRIWGASLISVPTGQGDLIAIAAGGSFGAGLKRDGTVIAFGTGDSGGDLNVPAGLDNVVAISAYNNKALALKSDGTVVNWGNYGSDYPPNGLNNVVAIAAGSPGDIALRADGTVVSWGYNPPQIPVDLNNVVAIAASDYDFLALKADGTVTVIGYGPAVPAGLGNVVAVAAGLGSNNNDTSYALKSDGSIVVWGNTTDGQGPVPVGLTNVAALSAGSDYALALKTDGTVVAWGQGDNNGQVTPPPDLMNVFAVSASFNFALALRDAANDVAPAITTPPVGVTTSANLPFTLSVTATGSPLAYQWLRNGTPVYGAWNSTYSVAHASAADTGSYQVMVSNSLGTVTSNYVGVSINKANPVITWAPPAPIVAGTTLSSVQLNATANVPGYFIYSPSAGTVLPAGSQTLTANFYPADGNSFYNGSAQVTIQVNTAATISNVESARQVVNPGGPAGFIVTVNGAGPFSYQWLHNGRPIAGATSTSYALNSVTAADAGWYLVVVTDANNTVAYGPPSFVIVRPTAGATTRVVAWGSNLYGQSAIPSTLTNAWSVTAGEFDTPILKNDGTVVAYGNYASGHFGDAQNAVPAGLTDLVELASNWAISAGLKSDGTVTVWGSNFDGEGNIPAGLNNVVSVSTGSGHILALKSDGTVAGWGYNFAGQAVVPANLANVVSVAAGSYHSLALKADGTVVAWGYNSNGATNVPNTLNNVIAIAGGGYHSLALKSDGTVVAWGDNTYGQSTVPNGLNNVIAIAGGENHSLALKSDGTVVAWGWNAAGQATVPAGLSHVTAIAGGMYHSVALVNSATVGDVDGDLNGDGSPDIVWQNPTTGDRAVWYLNGGAFLGTDSLGTVPPEWSIAAVADFDGDHHADLLWQNSQTGERLFWLMNGTTFLSSVSLGAISPDWTIAGTGDFNADGQHDLVWRNTVTGECLIWLMNGTTYLSSVSLGTVPPASVLVGVGDFLRHGRSDLVWQNTVTGEVYLWTMNGTTFGSRVSVGFADHNLYVAAIGDYDGDGNTDILFTNAQTGDRILWRMGGTTLLSTSTFTSVSVDWTLGRPFPPHIPYNPGADFDGDRTNDLLWQNFTTGERLVWKMNGTTYLSSLSLGSVSPDWAIMAAADFDLDGKLDLLWQNFTTGELVIWLMDGTVYKSSVSLGVLPTEWRVAAAGDINGDGSTDIAFQNLTTGDINFWFMNGTAFATGHPLSRQPAVRIIGAADFNGDRTADLVVENTLTRAVVIWLMNSQVNYIAQPVGVAPAGWEGAGVSDVDGDGTPDILWTDTRTGKRWAWIMNGTSVASTLQLADVPTAWTLGRPFPSHLTAAAPADFNGDGQSDIVWQNTSSGDRVVWLMNGTAFASGADLGTTSTDWSIAASGDFNGDGQADVVWENTATGEHYVWLMNGTTFASSVFLGVVPSPWRLADVADFNGDGQPDLVWENTSTGEHYVWLMNGTTFVSSVFLGVVPTQWRVAAAGDFNGDGQPDLVWENTSTGERYVWLMNGTAFSSAVSLGVLPVEWHVAATGDFNGDGQTDLVWQNSSTGERYIWLMNGTTFASSVYLGTVSTDWSIRN